MTPSVTVLGLGPMGHAIASALLTTGHTVTVWNRSPGKAEELEQLGAHVADNPAAAVLGSDLVLVSVRGNAVARNILERAELLRSKPSIVNLSSDTPTSARSLASWVAEQGARYLGGAILTPSTLVGQPGSTAVLGGSCSLYTNARSTLDAIALDLTYFSDDPGSVAALDLALLDAFWSTIAGWSHALALGRSEGLSAAALTDRLTAMVHLAAHIGGEIAEEVEAGSYPGDVSTVASAHTTLTHLLHASQDRHLDLSIPTAIKGLLERGIDAGMQDDGPSRLVPLIQHTGLGGNSDRP